MNFDLQPASAALVVSQTRSHPSSAAPSPGFALLPVFPVSLAAHPAPDVNAKPRPNGLLLASDKISRNSFRIRTSRKLAYNLFGMNTYRTLDLKFFRMNTYKKTRGEG